MASDKAELSSVEDSDAHSDEEYIPPESIETPKPVRKRKRKIIESSEDEENDDDLKHNDNKPLPRRKKRKLTPQQTTVETQNVSNNKTQKRSEHEEDCKDEQESYFCDNIDEGALIKMADFVEDVFHQNNPHQSSQCQEPECNSVTICPMYLKHFKITVCRECKWKQKYKCLSKTNAKKQYLLSEGDINSLNCWIKEIKKNNNNNNSNQWMPKYMKLYLIYQLEELSIEKYGSKEGIEAERNRREVNRMQRAISNARKKRKNKFECLEDIEVDKKVIEEHESNLHVHTFGEAQCVNEETDEWSKKCTECDYVETWEEF